MGDFSTWSGDNLLNLALRGVTWTPPTEVWMSMHDGDPARTGANEVDTADWPAYTRVEPAQGAAIGTGFAAAASRATANAKDMLFPRHDGAGNVTVSYVGFWDAPTGGNFICRGVVVDGVGSPAPKTFAPDDEAIFYAGEILVVAD